MNTTENNKLIAEFMGRSGKVNKHLFTWQGIEELTNSSTNIWVSVSEMKFHSSWDWLMQVVEKIEGLNLGDRTINTCFDEEDLYQNANVTFVIEYKDCYLNLYGDMKVYQKWIDINQSVSKIKAVYNAVVEFIKWYNGQNK